MLHARAGQFISPPFVPAVGIKSISQFVRFQPLYDFIPWAMSLAVAETDRGIDKGIHRLLHPQVRRYENFAHLRILTFFNSFATFPASSAHDPEPNLALNLDTRFHPRQEQAARQSGLGWRVLLYSRNARVEVDGDQCPCPGVWGGNRCGVADGRMCGTPRAATGRGR